MPEEMHCNITIVYGVETVEAAFHIALSGTVLEKAAEIEKSFTVAGRILRDRLLPTYHAEYINHVNNT